MSYVIQNFFDTDKKLITNYRIKYFLFFYNFKLIHLFFKTQVLTPLTPYYTLTKNNFLIFQNRFFRNNWIKFFYQNNHHLPTYYTNNLYLSIIYWNLFKLKNTLLFNPKHTLFLNLIGYNPIENLYWKPIKSTYIELNKNFYDKIIFLFFYYNHFWWFNFTKNFNFFKTFLIVTHDFKLNYFLNNFFFPIYNF